MFMEFYFISELIIACVKLNGFPRLKVKNPMTLTIISGTPEKTPVHPFGIYMHSKNTYRYKIALTVFNQGSFMQSIWLDTCVVLFI